MSANRKVRVVMTAAGAVFTVGALVVGMVSPAVALDSGKGSGPARETAVEDKASREALNMKLFLHRAGTPNASVSLASPIAKSGCGSERLDHFVTTPQTKEVS